MPEKFTLKEAVIVLLGERIEELRGRFGNGDQWMGDTNFHPMDRVALMEQMMKDIGEP